jgi:hypothetical protein
LSYLKDDVSGVNESEDASPSFRGLNSKGKLIAINDILRNPDLLGNERIQLAKVYFAHSDESSSIN